MGVDSRYELQSNGLHLPEKGSKVVHTERKPLFVGKNSAAYQEILDRSQDARFLLVNAHADDEFPASGLIARLREEYGMTPDLAVFTASEGEDLRTPRVISGDRMRGARQQELLAASEVIGVSRLYSFNEPDGGLKPRLDLALGLARVIRETKPALMIVPSGDPREHPDHKAAFELSNMARKLAALPVGIEGSSGEHHVPLFVEEEIMHVNPDRFPHLVDTSEVVDQIAQHKGAYITQVGGYERYSSYFTRRGSFNGYRMGHGIAQAEAYRVSNGEAKSGLGLDLPPSYHPVSHPVILRV